MRHYKILVKDKTTDQLITINVLEFLTEIINFAALIEHLRLQPVDMPHRYPILKNWTDNMTALSWIRKVVSKSPMAKALQRILCSIMSNNPTDLCGDFLAGALNVDADIISRIYFNSNVPQLLNK